MESWAESSASRHLPLNSKFCRLGANPSARSPTLGDPFTTRSISASNMNKTVTFAPSCCIQLIHSNVFDARRPKDFRVNNGPFIATWYHSLSRALGANLEIYTFQRLGVKSWCLMLPLHRQIAYVLCDSLHSAAPDSWRTTVPCLSAANSKRKFLRFLRS